MPSFTIYMREEVFRVLEEVCRQKGQSRGMVLSDMVMRYGTEKRVHAEGAEIRTRVRK